MKARDIARSRLILDHGLVKYHLTCQALHMRNEVFKGGGMDVDTFTGTYLGGMGDYEKQVARLEGISIKEPV